MRGRQCELVARLCGCRYDKHILYFPFPSCVTFQILHQCRMRNVRLVDTATLRQNGSWTQQDRSSTPFLCVVHSHGSANGAFLTRPPPRASRCASGKSSLLCLWPTQMACPKVLCLDSTCAMATEKGSIFPLMCLVNDWFGVEASPNCFGEARKCAAPMTLLSEAVCPLPRSQEGRLLPG